LPGLRPCGIHMHIGSQITDLEPFADAFALLDELAGWLREDGLEVEFVNFGGGLGVPYRGDDDVPPDPKAYAATVLKAVQGLNCRLIFEPGRMIAGNAGLMVARVLYLKRGPSKSFTIVDAGMNDLLRPTLYSAYHEIWPVDEGRLSGPRSKTDVVGPVCETGDFIALERELPEMHSGDLLAVLTAGAYGAVLANTYNSRPLVPEVMVRGGDYAVIRPRPAATAPLEAERMPDWLTKS